jgi:hypothetical protein
LARTLDYPGFLGPSREMPEWYLKKLHHDYFLPHPCPVHYFFSSSYLILYVVLVVGVAPEFSSENHIIFL